MAIPLSLTTVKVFRDSIAQTKITEVTNQWVRQYPSDVVLRSVLVSGGLATILVTGSEPPPGIDDLGAQIKSEVAHVTQVDLRYVPSRDFRYPPARDSRRPSP